MKSAAAKREVGIQDLKPGLAGKYTWKKEDLLAYTAQAVRDGRHSTTLTTICDGCGEWVHSIMFVVPGTHRRLCPKCAPPDLK